MMTFISFRKYLAVALSCILITACSTPKYDYPVAPIKLTQKSAISPDLAPYAVQIGDTLNINLLWNPELSEEVTVGPDGYITTRVVQDVIAYGRTLQDIKTDLNEYYLEILNEPGLSVSVEEYAPTYFYVLGEVEKPGEYVHNGPRLTLLQAMAMAGDIQNSAKTKQLVITRQTDTEVPMHYIADYHNAAHGIGGISNIPLAPYDIIFVPRTDVAEAFVKYEQHVQKFIRPSFGIGASYRINNEN